MDKQQPNNAMRSWEKLLHPQTLRGNLILASLYLSAYEILRWSIIDRIESFFTIGFEGDRPVIDKDYDQVKRLDKDILRASCLWLQENGAITAEDIAEIQKIRRHRNEIAHELPALLSNIDREINLKYLQDIRRLLKAIETWWIRNVNLAIDPTFANADIADNDIQPGPVIMLNLIIQIALDNADND